MHYKIKYFHSNNITIEKIEGNNKIYFFIWVKPTYPRKNALTPRMLQVFYAAQICKITTLFIYKTGFSQMIMQTLKAYVRQTENIAVINVIVQIVFYAFLNRTVIRLFLFVILEKHS